MEPVSDSTTAARSGRDDESWDDLVDAIGGIDAWHEKFAGPAPSDQIVAAEQANPTVVAMSEQDYADWEQAGGPIANMILEERRRREQER